MQSMAARGSMLGHTRLAGAPQRMLVAAPRRTEVIVAAVPKKKMSKSKTNLRFTVWMEQAKYQATLALNKGRVAIKQKDAEAGAAAASTGVAPASAPAADK